MLLSHALRLESEPRLALTGAGGKTSALFHLARELVDRSRLETGGTVLLTATTHLAVDQLALADHHFFVERPGDLDALEAGLPEGVILLTGPVVEAGRVAGLETTLLERLFELAESHRLPLLIEADGSRQRPVKAPAEHEPVVPSWVKTVVVVAGLSALGRPLSAEWVHRPERFASLSGLPAGGLITPEALSNVLNHPHGGLKGIPGGVRRIALLNQADTPELRAAAQRLASSLFRHFPSVVIAALQSQPQGANVFSVWENCAGIVLAAGRSSRLGEPKQLLVWRGKPLVWHAACTALDAGLSPVVVVTGAYGNQVQAALEGLPVIIAHNPDWEGGQGISVAMGMRALPPETGAAIFMLADQPQVPELLVRSLVDLHRRTLTPIAAPQAGGRRANPVLFDRAIFPDLMKLSGDAGGRVLFSRYRIEWLPWHDENLLLDVDTPEDYQRLLEIDP